MCLGGLPGDAGAASTLERPHPERDSPRRWIVSAPLMYWWRHSDQHDILPDAARVEITGPLAVIVSALNGGCAASGVILRASAER